MALNTTIKTVLYLRLTKFWGYSRCSVDILKFLTLDACQKGIDKQRRHRSDCFSRSSLIRVFSVCYSDKHCVNSSHNNQHFIWEQKEKSVWTLGHLPLYKAAFRALCMLFFLHAFYLLLIFFKQKILQEYNQSDKQVWTRSAWSGSKLFANVISKQQKSSLAEEQ